MTNETIATLKFWCQKVLPLVYDDSLSYYEVLCKVREKLNEVITVTNEIPSYIKEEIKNQIDGDTVQQILSELLVGYMLNVKNPPAGLTPASGDGSEDDTEAIQGCIDYAKDHNMAVYFPAGNYLTQPLTLSGKVSLFGFDRYKTRLVLKGGAESALLNGSVDTISIHNLGFDGNGSIQVNDVNLIELSLGSGIISNAYLTDGYVLMTADVANDLQLDNIIFDKATFRSATFNGENIQGDNIICNSISAVAGECFIDMSTDYSILEKVKCIGSAPTDIIVRGQHNIVKFWGGNVTNAYYLDEGLNNEFEVYTVSASWQKELADEITARENGDTALSDRIDTLNTTVTNNYNTLTTNIQSEASTRELADNALESRLNTTDNNLSNEVQAREAGDAVLDTKIDNEISERESAVTNLNTSLTNYIDGKISETETEVTGLAERLEDIESNRIYNVKDFGAKGDGVTDDTQAIKDCLAFMNQHIADGKNAYLYAVFPSGAYVVSSQIELPAGIGIKGITPRNPINPTNDAPTAGTWFIIKDNKTLGGYDDFADRTEQKTYGTFCLNDGCSIDGVGFYYPAQKNPDSLIAYRYTIVIPRSTRCAIVTNVLAENPYDFIYCGRAHVRTRISHIFGNPIHRGIVSVYSVDIQRWNDIHFHVGLFSHVYAESGDAPTYQAWLAKLKQTLVAFTIVGDDWSDYNDLFVYGCLRGVRIVNLMDGTTQRGSRHVCFKNLKIEQATLGVLIQVPDDSSVDQSDTQWGHRYLTFMNCNFICDDIGVYVSACRTLRIENCYFDAGTHAFYIPPVTSTSNPESNVREIMLMNNAFAAAKKVCAVISADKAVVVGNTFRNGSKTDATRYGISLYNKCTHAVITDNIFLEYYTNHAIRVLGNQVTDLYINNNAFYGGTSVYINENSNIRRGIVQHGIDGYNVANYNANDDIRMTRSSATPSLPNSTTQVLFFDAQGRLAFIAPDGSKKLVTYTNG